MVMPLWDESPFDLPKWPVVTWGLIIANIVVFVFELAAPDGAFDAFAVVPAQVTGSTAVATGVPPYVTLVTSMFLHANLLHIFGNMLFLWIFGDDVEEAMGPLRFLVFYLVCGIAAALAFVASAPQSPTSLIGASGAIAGVLAAYLMFRPCQKVAVFIPWFILWLFIRPVVRIDAFWVLGLWIVTAVLGGLHAVPGWRRLYGPYRRICRRRWCCFRCCATATYGCSNASGRHLWAPPETARCGAA